MGYMANQRVTSLHVPWRTGYMVNLVYHSVFYRLIFLNHLGHSSRSV
jgi:hypothetical protein